MQIQFHFAVNGTCKLNFITRLQKSLTISAFAIKTINELTGRLQLFYKYRLGYKQFLIDVTSNVCDYIDGKAGSKVMDFIMPVVQKYVGRKFTCPYSGTFNVKNMPLNWEIFDNVFLPTGSFMMNITLTVGSSFLWNCKIYFNVPEVKTAEDDRMG